MTHSATEELKNKSTAKVSSGKALKTKKNKVAASNTAQLQNAPHTRLTRASNRPSTKLRREEDEGIKQRDPLGPKPSIGSSTRDRMSPVRKRPGPDAIKG